MIRRDRVVWSSVALTFAVVGMAVGVACGGTTPPANEPPSPPASPLPSSEATPPTSSAPSSSGSSSDGDKACATDADCEIVELGCCDHCNGGEAGAFNKASAAMHKPKCGPTRCTRRGCAPVTASCVDRQCTVVTSPMTP